MESFEIGRLIYLVLLGGVIAVWFFLQSRDGLNKVLQQAAIWALIFVGGAAGVALWQDIARPVGGERMAVTGQGQLVVPQARDGHYYLTAQINGAPVRFVLDTGASQLVLTQADAARVGIGVEDLIYQGRARTANGEVRTAFVRLGEVRLGDAVDRDVAAVVNEGEMDGSLLGMGYLQRWGRIEIADGELILTR